MIMNTKQELKFKVFCSTNTEHLTKGLVNEYVEENKPLILEGIASSSNVDLEGDYMTQECLEDMKKQALGLSIFLDHEHTINSIVGKITHVLESSADIFKIKFSVLPSYEWYLLEFLEYGINLGLSIGAKVLDFEETEKGWQINKVQLLEVSIVGIPANPDTRGTVKISKNAENIVTAKCFNGACKQIIDNLESSDLVKELEDGKEEDDECLTRNEVVSMINEASNVLKDQIITEIVSEFNLDGQKYQEETPETDTKDDKSNSSTEDEDKEKKFMEMDKLKDLVALTIKELNEAEAEVETPEPVEEEEVEANVEVEEQELEKSTEEDLSKSCEEDEDKEDEEKDKEVEEETEKSFDVDEAKTIIKSIIEEERAVMQKEFDEERAVMKKQLQEEVESEILKALSVEREPKATSTKEAEKEVKVEETKSSNGAVSTRKMAEMFCDII